MNYPLIITEEILNSQCDYTETRGLIPELVYRLIIASVGNPEDIRIPFGGSVNQAGPDGLLITKTSFNPYVPVGHSIWEIGTGNDPQTKATEDYEKRTKEFIGSERASMTFIFVTSRSAVSSWSEPNQRKWLEERINRKEWKDVKILDGTKIVQWLSFFPEISLWLAEKFNIPSKGVSSPALHWRLLESYGSPPKLKPSIFLTGRDKAKEEVLKIFRNEINQLSLETKYPQDGVDFVVAVLASLDQSERDAFTSRCLLIDDPETWKSICSLQCPHVLIAKPSFDLGGNEIELIQNALTNKHSVIYIRIPRGSSHGNTALLKDIKQYELSRALEDCGYPAERSRVLSERCGGKLTVLKRLLSGFSASPEWSTTSVSGDLAKVCLIGQWDGNVEGDREAIEGILGNNYSEWLGKIRPITNNAEPPLFQRDEKWRFVSRYESWENLGPQISNIDLDRFNRQALIVLKHKDPKYELSKEERWKASIYNKTNKYSDIIKMGFAETLALLGSYPNMLTSCSPGKPQSIAEITISEIFKDSDWVNWATVNDILPLLAESSPEQFLNAVERILSNQIHNVFNDLFSQEGTGFLQGGNYMTGVLWALETLAWHQDYLTRVSLILAKLTEIDPGGNWANRPLNSLSLIYLPWYPQTCAPISIRKVAIESIVREYPNTGWKLLMTLLPQIGQISTGCRKPTWRQYLPPDWSERVTKKERYEQIELYATLAIQNAKSDFTKLKEIINRIDDIPLPLHSEIYNYLTSDEILLLSDQKKSEIWEALLDVINKHRKYSDADWAMPKDHIEKIEKIADDIKPSQPELLYHRLFCKNSYDLIEQKNNYEEQIRILDDKRVKAIDDILTLGGIEGVFKFIQTIDDALQVGIALGKLVLKMHQSSIIPKLIDSNDEKKNKFVTGYILSSFDKMGWEWVDSIDFNDWTLVQKTTFLSLLPFGRECWGRVKRILGENEEQYWRHTNTRPYDLLQDEITEAVDKLLKHGRPRAAIQCLYFMINKKMEISCEQVYQSLMCNLKSEEPTDTLDHHTFTEIIKWAQNNSCLETTKLSQIEWVYLPLLDRNYGLAPKTLERHLANDPEFYCEVIRLVFRSDKEDKKTIKRTRDQEQQIVNAYDLLYKWRIPPGSNIDGSFDGSKLNMWLNKVKQGCELSGHLKIVLEQVGKVLVYSPPDPTGLWIHKEAASVLDKMEHVSMRLGFKIELFNQRGVFSWTAGKAEKELAETYRNKALAVEQAGFIQLATLLRDMALSYEREADREAARDPHEY